jgi:hypothetical protein
MRDYDLTEEKAISIGEERRKQFKPSGYFDNNLLSGMTPAISEVVLKETFPQYFSSKLILVLQIKLKYMMSFKSI